MFLTAPVRKDFFRLQRIRRFMLARARFVLQQNLADFFIWHRVSRRFWFYIFIALILDIFSASVFIGRIISFFGTQAMEYVFRAIVRVDRVHHGILLVWSWSYWVTSLAGF